MQAVEFKAIETYFDGYRFRSRLEARWAVFFKTLGIPYEYEIEGYQMGDLFYLPDFWLPEQEYWIEIKGEYPDEGEDRKARMLCEGTDQRVYLFYEGIPDPDRLFEACSCFAYFPSQYYDGTIIAQRDEDYRWCQCPVCGYCGVSYCGKNERLPCPHQNEWGKGSNYASDELVEAYRVARSARFESFSTKKASG